MRAVLLLTATVVCAAAGPQPATSPPTPPEQVHVAPNAAPRAQVIENGARQYLLNVHRALATGRTDQAQQAFDIARTFLAQHGMSESGLAEARGAFQQGDLAGALGRIDVLLARTPAIAAR